MKKINTVNAIAALFVVMVVGTLALGIAFQTPPHDHDHDHTAQVDHDHADHNGADLQEAFSAQAQEYTCSMHPSFRSTDPNERCPICGMELIPVAAGGSDDEFVRIEFTGRSLALLGLQTEPVQQGTAHHEIRLTGQIDFDERALTSISAWTGGRIERLYVNYSGAQVETNAPLVELYSPDLFVAQQELLQAYRQSRQQAPEFLRDSQAMTLRAARERLRLLGLSQTQIDQIIERGEARDRVTIRAPSSGLVVTRNVSQGDYVNTGDILLELADSRQLWALFEVFERDLGSIQVGQSLEFTLGSQSSALSGDVVSIAPRIDAERRTRTVRVAINQTEAGLVAGAFTRATVKIEVPDVLTIPKSAPLITGKRALVYVQTEAQGGEFEARTVELGRRLGDRYEVLSGLSAGEMIVSRGAFRIDSELQLRGRPSMMAPEGGGATGHEHHGHEIDAGNGHAHDSHETHASPTDMSEQVSFDAELHVEDVFQAYHHMWEALHSDDLGAWQNAAEAFYGEVAAVQWSSSLNEVQDLLEQGMGHAHHVTRIATARDHFFDHSRGMIALAQAGYHQGELHLMFCPMARRGQGAFWLQQDDSLLNPYFGAQMLRCGDHEGVLQGHGGHHE
ncbi:efflux RND transporter periplasmic adaptor subunit [Aliidiomarina indica]|uniref:efflux RND transporter periplasmic adaptor subunit n=1 Tax=Aliidiomarina indica TaxID=2749147 RepID=UPI00188E9EB2|nr:efflux RND transporter periplasmic adaptor subunit [Aliidiomarina indica]